MTDREKLIELLRSSTSYHTEKRDEWVLGGKHGERPSITESMADYLLANGVTFATDTNAGSKWISVEDDKPDEFVSVLGHMTDAGDFPAVRECYWVGYRFFFPALQEFHPVDRWRPMPEED